MPPVLVEWRVRIVKDGTSLWLTLDEARTLFHFLSEPPLVKEKPDADRQTLRVPQA